MGNDWTEDAAKEIVYYYWDRMTGSTTQMQDDHNMREIIRRHWNRAYIRRKPLPDLETDGLFVTLGLTEIDATTISDALSSMNNPQENRQIMWDEQRRAAAEQVLQRLRQHRIVRARQNIYAMSEEADERLPVRLVAERVSPWFAALVWLTFLLAMFNLFMWLGKGWIR